MPNLEIKVKNLHKICMVLGEIKQNLVPELPHFGHHGLFFQNDEITTGLMNNTTEIKINLLTGQLLDFANECGTFVDLYNDEISEKLQQIFPQKDLEVTLLENPDKQELSSYHDFATKAIQILELFRMNLRDKFTLVHLWPHHFDFSLEWFTGIKDEQIGTGISPGDEQYPNPYLYMNPWPFNEKITKEQLPIGKWHTDNWNGIKVEWDELMQFSPHDAAKKITELFFVAKKSF